MIVAITGGTGFIGYRLALNHLAAGDDVRILTRRPIARTEPLFATRIFRGDLVDDTDPLVSFADGADILYHCAGELRDKSRMAAVHVEGITNLIAAARGRIGRWVQLSSVGVYGQRRHGTITEKSLTDPVGTYEETKFRADKILLSAGQDGAFDYALVRPSIVFGRGMPNQSLFQLIGMVDRSLFTFVGKPGAVANYIHVTNVVDALILCGSDHKASQHTYIVSDQCNIETFVAYISEALGKAPPRFRLPEYPVRMLASLLSLVPRSPISLSRIDALTSRVRYSDAKLRDHLGFTSRVSLQAGISELVELWRKKG